MKLIRSPHVVATLVLATVFGAGCDFQRRSSSIAPSSTNTPNNGGGNATPSYTGTWSSANVNDLPSQLQGCANFQWTVSSQTAESISGEFTATCTGGIVVTGTGTGQLMGQQLQINIHATANISGVICNITLNGMGTYEGDRIVVPFSGNSCYGPFSGVETLRRGSLPGPPPPSSPPPPPPPSNTVCAFNNGPQIVECVAAKYPERLVGGISLEQRQANMMFLRDRIIEGGLCGGLEFGWNLKRGGPELSIDFLAWRRNGENIGVDIAFDYDNTGNTLELQWLEVGPGAFFAEYPAPNCGG
jgi:hypothetical protein